MPQFPEVDTAPVGLYILILWLRLSLPLHSLPQNQGSSALEPLPLLVQLMPECQEQTTFQELGSR